MGVSEVRSRFKVLVLNRNFEIKVSDVKRNMK